MSTPEFKSIVLPSANYLILAFSACPLCASQYWNSIHDQTDNTMNNTKNVKNFKIDHSTIVHFCAKSPQAHTRIDLHFALHFVVSFVPKTTIYCRRKHIEFNSFKWCEVIARQQCSSEPYCSSHVVVGWPFLSRTASHLRKDRNTFW